MALTYEQLDALTTNATFLGRVREAVAYHANYVLNLPGSASQVSWAGRVFQGQACAQIAANLARELCQDAAITASATGDGSDVTDAALQAAVDKICEGY